MIIPFLLVKINFVKWFQSIIVQAGYKLILKNPIARKQSINFIPITTQWAGTRGGGRIAQWLWQ